MVQSNQGFAAVGEALSVGRYRRTQADARFLGPHTAQCARYVPRVSRRPFQLKRRTVSFRTQGLLPYFQISLPSATVITAENAAVGHFPDAMEYENAPGQPPPDAKLEPDIHSTFLRRRERANSALLQLRAVKAVASQMHRTIVVERWRVKCRFWWQGPCDNANALASCLPHMHMSRR